MTSMHASITVSCCGGVVPLTLTRYSLSCQEDPYQGDLDDGAVRGSDNVMFYEVISDVTWPTGCSSVC